MLDTAVTSFHPKSDFIANTYYIRKGGFLLKSNTLNTKESPAFLSITRIIHA